MEIIFKCGEGKIRRSEIVFYLFHIPKEYQLLALEETGYQKHLLAFHPTVAPAAPPKFTTMNEQQDATRLVRP
jgi:hypothetical protein